MSQFLTPDTFEFFARYLLAGYVVILVRSRFIVGTRAKTADLFIEAVLFSLLVQMVLYFLAPLLGWLVSPADEWIDRIAIPERLQLFVEVLVLPAGIGFLLGKNLSSGWNNAVLRRLSMPVTQPVHRAHDYAFTHNRSAGLVILTYFDGTVVYGYFGEQSLAASDAERSDIYLQRLYDVNEDGQWIELIPTRSALLSLESVRSIEFLDEMEVENGEDQSHPAG